MAAPSVFGANIVKKIEKKKLWRGKIEGVAFGEKLFKIQFKINQIFINSLANEGKGVALRARNYSKIKFKN